MAHQITGAIAVGDKTYRAGDEEAFDEAVAKAEKTDTPVDIERLTRKGHLTGYGKGTAEAVHTVNMQRNADGSRADPDVEEEVEATDEATGTTTKTKRRSRKAR